MPYSVVTSRGQTTIPKIIRFFLGIRPSDKIVYVIDQGKVILEPVSGDILDLKGTIKTEETPIDFKGLREKTKKRVAKKILKEIG